MTTDLLTRPDARLWTPENLEILDDVTRREFLAGLAAAGLLAGCATSDPVDAPPATRTVTDALGPVDVPVAPRRVVTLDQYAFEAATALDAPVVGAVANGPMTDPAGPVAALLDGVERVGSVGEPNLEAIAALAPDLILGGFPNDSALDGQLKQIAPAWLGIAFETSAQWKEIVTAVGATLGRDEDAAALLAEYAQRAQRTGAGLPAELTVSSVRPYPGVVRVYGAATFAGVVCADAGIDLTVPAVPADRFGADLSPELIGELTADVLIVWTANEDDPAAALDQLTASPLWSTLPAVRGDRVVFGGQYWLGGGLYAARAVLDDLTALTRR